jgi:putative solute:sodium symporter small subunit
VPDAPTHAGGAPRQGPRPDLRADPRVRACLEAYWRRNLRLMAGLLAIWAFVGLGCGVLLADWLNRFSLGGYPLGFWFAQQGSILVFVALIGIYALAMRHLDRRHHAELEALRGDAAARASRS